MLERRVRSIVRVSVSVLFLVGISAVGQCQWLRMGSPECPNWQTALQKGKGRTVLIDTPQRVEGEILIPSEMHLVFQDQGKLVREPEVKSIRVMIQGSLTAPLQTIFEGFQPGEIVIPTGRVREVYPQWWGAKGDGKADDTLSLQCAISSGSSFVFIPRGSYRITKPLDLTNRIDGLTVMGASHVETEQGGTRIVGETGSIVIDMTGAQYVRLERLYITAGKTNPSTVGILLDRSKEVPYCSGNTFEGIKVDLPSIPNANKGYGTIGLYCVAAEDNRAYALHIGADKSIIFTSSDFIGISSPYRERAHIGSMAGWAILNAILHAHRGPAIILANAVDIHILRAYIWVGGGETEPLNPSRYAILVIERAQNISVNAHVEGGPRFLHARGRLYQCEFKATMTGPISPLIYLDGSVPRKEEKGGLVACRIDLYPLSEWFKVNQPHQLLLSEKGCFGVINTTLQIHPNQRLQVEGGQFQGNLLFAEQDEPEVIVQPEGSPSYILFSPKGIQVVGTMVGRKE